MFAALILVASAAAGPMTCKAVERLSHTQTPLESAMTWLPNQGVVAADLPCIEALGLDPVFLDVAKRNLIGEIPEGRDDLLVVRPEPIIDAPHIVWVGIDYSEARFIDSLEFDHPDQIFPAKLILWNRDFILEQLPRLEQSFGKQLTVDDTAMEELVGMAGPDQVTLVDTSSHQQRTAFLGMVDLRTTVRKYQAVPEEGLGYTWIVEKLDKNTETMALHQVFFDLETREIYSAHRVESPASGVTFSKHWYRPLVYSMDEASGVWRSHRRRAKAAHRRDSKE